MSQTVGLLSEREIFEIHFVKIHPSPSRKNGYLIGEETWEQGPTEHSLFRGTFRGRFHYF